MPDLVSVRPHGPQVEMLTVLRGLGFGDADEPQGRTALAGWLDPYPVNGAVLVHVRPERLRPESCQE